MFTKLTDFSAYVLYAFVKANDAGTVGLTFKKITFADPVEPLAIVQVNIFKGLADPVVNALIVN